MIVHPTVQSPTRTLFTMLFCSETYQRCLIQAHSVTGEPYSVIIACNSLLEFIRNSAEESSRRTRRMKIPTMRETTKPARHLPRHILPSKYLKYSRSVRDLSIVDCRNVSLFGLTGTDYSFLYTFKQIYTIITGNKIAISVLEVKK